MKKNCCVICEIELEESEKELCENCFGFFSRKYKKGFKKELSRFRKSNRFLDKWKNNDISKKEVEE